MKTVYCIRQLIISSIATFILCWAFASNNIFGKIIIIPFLICSISIFFENLFVLLNKEKLSNIFKYIFRISLFTYIFGFLIIISFYALKNKTYTLFMPIIIFFIIATNFFKIAFKKNKTKKRKTTKEDDIINAHKYSIHNKEKLLKDNKCGCFYCLKIFNPNIITKWVENDTALCPYCGIDSVIGKHSGYPITKEFLSKMNKYWF